MPYTMKWVQEPYLMEVALIDVVSEQDTIGLIDDQIAMFSASPQHADAHVLLDATRIDKLPQIAVLQREINRQQAALPTRSGMTLVFGVSRLFRYVVELLARIADARFKVFDTREEAEEFAWQMIEIEAHTRSLNQQADEE